MRDKLSNSQVKFPLRQINFPIIWIYTSRKNDKRCMWLVLMWPLTNCLSQCAWDHPGVSGFLKQTRDCFRGENDTKRRGLGLSGTDPCNSRWLKMHLFSPLWLKDIGLILCILTKNSLQFSEIPLLRPPKIKTFYPLKTLFAKFKLYFSSFSTPSVSLIRDHLWDCPKVVFKTTFGQS